MSHRLSALFVMLVLAAGCTSSPQKSTAGSSSVAGESTQVKTAQSASQSGFLAPAVYAKLQPAPDREGVMVYINRALDLRPYRKIMFVPTQVYLVPNPEYKGLPKEALDRMTRDFQQSFMTALQPEYIIVTAPGPDVLQVRSAITGVQPVSPPLGATDFIPIKALFNVARKASGGAPQVAEMSAEFEVLAPDGAVAGAATASRKGDQRLSQGSEITWNDMQSISDYWARNFRQRLDEVRGVGRKE
jgi:hypothetical protein